jgi:hypothetical protein
LQLSFKGITHFLIHIDTAIGTTTPTPTGIDRLAGDDALILSSQVAALDLQVHLCPSRLLQTPLQLVHPLAHCNPELVVFLLQSVVFLCVEVDIIFYIGFREKTVVIWVVGVVATIGLFDM